MTEILCTKVGRLQALQKVGGDDQADEGGLMRGACVVCGLWFRTLFLSSLSAVTIELQSTYIGLTRFSARGLETRARGDRSLSAT